MNDQICPYCKEEFYVPYKQWNIDTMCPHCNHLLEVEYDYIELEDGTEWYIYTTKEVKKHNLGEKILASKTDE